MPRKMVAGREDGRRWLAGEMLGGGAATGRCGRGCESQAEDVLLIGSGCSLDTVEPAVEAVGRQGERFWADSRTTGRLKVN